MKRILISVVLAIFFLSFIKLSDSEQFYYLEFQIGKIYYSSKNGRGTFYTPPLINYSKKYSNIDIQDRVMMDIDDIKNVIPSFSFNYKNKIIGMRFQYGGNEYIVGQSDDSTVISCKGKLTRMEPPPEYINGNLVFPIIQLFKLFKIEYFFDKQNLFIHMWVNEDVTKKPSETDFSYTGINATITDIAQKDGFILCDNGGAISYKIHVTDPKGKDLVVGKSYQFVCRDLINKPLTYDYICSRPISNNKTTEMSIWDGKPYYKFNGFAYETEIGFSPSVVNGQWLIPVEFFWGKTTKESLKYEFVAKSLTMVVTINNNVYKFDIGKKVARFYINRKRIEISMPAPATILNGTFCIPLKTMSVISNFSYKVAGNRVDIVLPFRYPIETLDGCVISVSNLYDVDYINGTAMTCFNQKKIHVRFQPATLLSGLNLNEHFLLAGFSTATDSGDFSITCYSLDSTTYLRGFNRNVATAKIVDADDETDYYQVDGKTYIDSGNLRYNQCIGDTYKIMGTVYENSLWFFSYLQVDPVTDLPYTKSYIQITSIDNGVWCKDLYGDEFELSFPKTPWSHEDFIHKDEKYWIIGIYNNKTFEVKRYGHYDFKPELYKSSTKIVYDASVDPNSDFISKTYVDIDILTYRPFEYFFGICGQKMFQNSNALVPLSDEIYYLGGHYYLSARDIAKAVKGRYSFDKSTSTLEFTWIKTEPHQWAYKDKLYFKTESVSLENWSVTGYVSSGDRVTLLLQDQAWMERFKIGKIIYIQVNEVDSNTYLCKNIFMSTDEHDLEFFDIAYTKHTKVGKIVSIEDKTLKMISDNKEYEFEWDQADEFKLDDIVVAEYFNKEQSKPARFFLTDGRHEMIKRTYAYPLSNKDIMMKNNVPCVLLDSLPSLFPIKSYQKSYNLTGGGCDTYIVSLGETSVAFKIGSPTALVNGKPVELSKNDIVKTESFRNPYLPLETVFKFFNISYSITDKNVSATFNAYPNPAASDIFNFDNVLLFNKSRGYLNKTEYRIYLANAAFRKELTDGEFYRFKGHYSSIDPTIIFVESIDPWTSGMY